MHTAAVADELVRRGHQVVLFAKEGSRSRARVRPIARAGFRYGLMPDAAGVDRSEALCARAEPGCGPADRPRPVRRGAEQLAQPGAVPGPGRGRHADPAAHPRRPAADQCGDRRPGWRPGARHAYAAVSEHTARDWRGRLPAVTVHPQRHRPAPLAAGPDRRDPSPTWPSGPPGSPRRKACRWPSGPAGPPGCGWRSPARSATTTTSIADVAPLLGDDARYVGHLDHRELPRLIRRGRVFVSSPLWPEPFGLALVEAMACGTPVAALPARRRGRGGRPDRRGAGGRTAAWRPWPTRHPPGRHAGPHGGPGQRAPLRPPADGHRVRVAAARAWSPFLSDLPATRSPTPRLLKGSPDMPLSSAEGKSWTKERIYALADAGPVTVLDIGPGVGTYAKLLAGPEVARLTGVEIFEPYVHTYRLREYYDEIIIGDAREVDLPAADVVILGDVAEHMTRRGGPGPVAAGRCGRPPGGVPVHPDRALPAGRDRGQPARAPRGRRLEARQRCSTAFPGHRRVVAGHRGRRLRAPHRPADRRTSARGPGPRRRTARGSSTSRPPNSHA